MFHSSILRRTRATLAGAAAVAALLLGVLPPAMAAPPAAGTVIRVVATASYVPAGLSQVERVNSNGVQATIATVEALLLTQDQSVVRPPNAQVTLTHLLSNVGNVASSYTLGWSNNGPGCASDTLDLGSLRIVRDTNSNGIAESNEPVLAIGTANALTLQPGETASLLVQGTVPNVASGNACLMMIATTALQSVSASNHDMITVSNAAVLQLRKTANFTGSLIPGTTRIDFTIDGTNIGNADAAPTGSALPGPAAITVNGAAQSMVLLSDVVPTGTQYIVGTLKSTAPGAVRLFRLPGDAPFNYRTAEDASAIEVALGLPTSIVRNGSVQMQFSTLLRTDATADVRNVASGYYNDGAQPAASPSNVVLIPLSAARIGVAKAADPLRSNRSAAGVPDGTADVTFNVYVKNYGSAALFDVQVPDVLEGAGSAQFGAYTSATTPAANQYTIVPASVRIVGSNGNMAGTVANANPSFAGTSGAPNLLASGAALPVGAQIQIQFTVRVNTTGRSGTLYNSVRAQAALASGTPAQVFDDSMNGTDPDPDGDGNPTNNAQPTPVLTDTAELVVVKSTSVPRRLASGVFEWDYSFKVTNTGKAAAPNVRVVDNLNCTFEMDKSSGSIAAWELQGPVRVQNGVLSPASSFTGKAVCDRAALASNNPYQVPTAVALNLTDGSRSLAPGQSETVSITVRATEKPNLVGGRVSLTNTAWVAAFDQNTVNTTPSMLINAASGSVQTLLVDPQGTVYDALSRQPVTGALVNLRRTSCTTGSAGPITLDQIFGGTSGAFTANADGSISMTTGSTGEFQFYMNSPPVTGLCTYQLTVTPPAGSGYLSPSQLLPVTSGPFATCGAIVPSAAPPQSGEPTTHYFSFNSGFNPDGSACDVVHDHIPLDPGSATGLVLEKQGSKSQVELGDFLDYALKITNKTGFPLTGVDFTDTLPAGFAYVAGSTRLNGVVSANPEGGAGPALHWRMPTLQLGTDQIAVVRYRVRVGVGARVSGDAVNRAQALSGQRSSNRATHTVRVNGGVFSDEAFAIGKVYMDCRASRTQAGADSPGVPGVRLYMEDGTNVITDGEGKWSLYGLKPVTHVLRIDETTLPIGARPELLDNRNANNPSSRFMDLKKGELHKADFPLLGCDDTGTMEEVTARRKALADLPGTDGETLVRTRLDPQGEVITVPTAASSRSMPASGQISGSGIGLVTASSQQIISRPLVELPTAPVDGGNSYVNSTMGAVGSMTGTLAQGQQGTGFLPLGGIAGGNLALLNAAGGPAAAGLPPNRLDPRNAPLSSTEGPLNGAPMAPGSIDLEKLLPELDNRPGFLDLKDQDTVAAQTLNVRVKGVAGTTLRLSINGQVIDGRRVGKKATLAKTNTTAWEYIGMVLKPGANTLRLDIVDDFGNERGEAAEVVIIAPDKLASVRIDVPSDARADLRTPVPVKITLSDAAGVPVTARTQLTVESSAGKWVEEDLNPGERGLQVFMQGGEAVLHLLPPGEPGDVRIRVSAAAFTQEARLTLLPDLRPMIGVGILEGTLDLTKRGKLDIGQMPAGAAFETELRSLNDSDDRRVGARAAFFFKGAVKGEYLLTAALDSDKSNKDRLFRDIRPDEFYPIYGDSSARGYDAQSSQRMYVRIDKNHSFLLYGDFITSSSTEVRKLSQTNRALTGLKDVYETDAVRITSYASRTSQTQQIEEFRAAGISGPYYLSNSKGDFVENSEQIEIVVRDRNQPNLIIQKVAATRFADYSMEATTGRILFTRPISSVDANLNPQSIRVTYEVDAGGTKYTVAGTDAQVKVGNNLQLGVVLNTDKDPENRRDIAAVTALARLGEQTSGAAELVSTDSDLKGQGKAGRLELRHQSDQLGITAQVAHSSDTFDNPAAGFSAGRTEANARFEYKIDPTLAARGEAIYSKDVLSSGNQQGATASLRKIFNDTFSGEVGLRYGTTSSSSASLFDYGQVSSYNSALGASQTGSSVTTLGSVANAATSVSNQQSDQTTVRGRLTAIVPSLPQAQVFVEGEQDVSDSSKHMAAVGGNYAVTDKTRVYGRYEFISTLGSVYDLSTTSARNTGILGVESGYMEGGRVYNEYRLADSLDGRTGQNATGIRNTIKLDDHWRVTGGIERTHAMGTSTSTSGTVGTGDSTAITSGVEYGSGRIKASGILEARQGDDSDTVLSSAGFGYKIDDSWSVLARSVYSDSKGKGSSEDTQRTLSRQQIGLAYRPVDTNVWNALARYEHKTERIRGDGTVLGTISGNAFGSDATLPGDYQADIVSLHVNVNPQPGNYYTARFAAKRSTQDDGILKSSYSAQLLQGRATWDINRDWDFGVQAGLMAGSGGSLQKTAGLEIGYQVYKDLWLSVGYNFVGLKDRDLTAGEYTSKGAFIRLRFKFDETSVGFSRAGASNLSGPAVSKQTTSGSKVSEEMTKEPD